MGVTKQSLNCLTVEIMRRDAASFIFALSAMHRGDRSNVYVVSPFGTTDTKF